MKRLLECIVVSVLILATFNGCMEDSTSKSENNDVLSYQDQYDLGVRFLSDGNYEEAIIAFKTAIEIDPRQEAAYIALAEVYVTLGETDKALEVLTQAAEVISESDTIDAALEQLHPSQQKMWDVSRLEWSFGEELIWKSGRFPAEQTLYGYDSNDRVVFIAKYDFADIDELYEGGDPIQPSDVYCYIYDDTGKIIEEHQYYTVEQLLAGTPSDIISYIYENGLLSKKTSSYEVLSTFTYHDDGSYIEETFGHTQIVYDSAGILMEHRQDNGMSSSYEYEDGNLIRHNLYFHGELDEYEVYEYDQSGNMIALYHWSGGYPWTPIRLDYYEKCDYDINGKFISLQGFDVKWSSDHDDAIRLDDTLVKTVTCEYDDIGNLTLLSIDQMDEYSGHPEYDGTFSYTYDENGLATIGFEQRSEF